MVSVVGDTLCKHRDPGRTSMIPYGVMDNTTVPQALKSVCLKAEAVVIHR